MGGMKDHGTGLFSEVPNAAFSDTILPMGIYSAVSDALVFLCESFLPRIVDESAIVCVVVANADAAIPSKEFKSIFGFKSFQGGGVLLQVNIADTAVVVHKDSGNAVATSSEATLQLGNKTNMARLHLINGDALTRGSGRLNVSALQLGAPGLPSCTGSAHGRITLG
jgi:hypothetical protein